MVITTKKKTRKKAPQDLFDYVINDVHTTNDVFRYDCYNTKPPRTKIIDGLIAMISCYPLTNNCIGNSKTAISVYNNDKYTIKIKFMITNCCKCRFELRWQYINGFEYLCVGYPYRYQDIVDTVELFDKYRDKFDFKTIKNVMSTVINKQLIRNPLLYVVNDDELQKIVIKKTAE